MSSYCSLACIKTVKLYLKSHPLWVTLYLINYEPCTGRFLLVFTAGIPYFMFNSPLDFFILRKKSLFFK